MSDVQLALYIGIVIGVVCTVLTRPLADAIYKRMTGRKP